MGIFAILFIIVIVIAIKKGKYNSNPNDESDASDFENTNEMESQNDHSYSLKCRNCGASLNYDPDNMIGFCPYCGHKILIDVPQMTKILAEKEKTKRESEKTLQEKERTTQEALRVDLEREKLRTEHRETIMAVVLFVLMITGFLIWYLVDQFSDLISIVFG